MPARAFKSAGSQLTPAATLPFRAETNWVSAFDRRVPLMTDLSTLDLRDFGAESREEEQYRLLAPHIKQEEEGKFRCKECSKLFSARKFVEKHLGLKHPDVLGNRLDEVRLFPRLAQSTLALITDPAALGSRLRSTTTMCSTRAASRWPCSNARTTSLRS